MKYAKTRTIHYYSVIFFLLLSFSALQLSSDSWVQKQSTPQAGVHGFLTVNPQTNKIYWHNRRKNISSGVYYVKLSLARIDMFARLP